MPQTLDLYWSTLVRHRHHISLEDLRRAVGLSTASTVFELRASLTTQATRVGYGQRRPGFKVYYLPTFFRRNCRCKIYSVSPHSEEEWRIKNFPFALIGLINTDLGKNYKVELPRCRANDNRNDVPAPIFFTECLFNNSFGNTANCGPGSPAMYQFCII